jgi:hypothetical protein
MRIAKREIPVEKTPVHKVTSALLPYPFLTNAPQKPSPNGST